MGWGGVQVTGHAAPGHANVGRIRWASQQGRLAPLGRSGPGNDLHATMLATEGDSHGDTSRANESPPGTGAPRTSEVDG